MKSIDDDNGCNTSGNENFQDVLDAHQVSVFFPAGLPATGDDDERHRASALPHGLHGFENLRVVQIDIQNDDVHRLSHEKRGRSRSVFFEQNTPATWSERGGDGFSKPGLVADDKCGVHWLDWLRDSQLR